MSGTLYIAGTPIGNRDDMTFRLKSTLQEIDAILAEDPRQTLKLLEKLEIKKPLHVCNEHTSPDRLKTYVEHLIQGKNLAFVSDAGTPGVSDPGAKLVALALEHDIAIVPIPGPSAVTTLVSVMGALVPGFHFWGFFPQKKIRQQELLTWMEQIEGIHVFFESPFRVIKTLESCFLAKPDWTIVIGREMTKQHEEFIRGNPQEVLLLLQKGVVKGEFCIGVVTHGI